MRQTGGGDVRKRSQKETACAKPLRVGSGQWPIAGTEAGSVPRRSSGRRMGKSTYHCGLTVIIRSGLSMFVVLLFPTSPREMHCSP